MYNIYILICILNRTDREKNKASIYQKTILRRNVYLLIPYLLGIEFIWKNILLENSLFVVYITNKVFAWKP